MSKNKVKVNMSKVKVMKEKSIVKLEPMLLSQNYFFRSNEV